MHQYQIVQQDAYLQSLEAKIPDYPENPKSFPPGRTFFAKVPESMLHDGNEGDEEPVDQHDDWPVVDFYNLRATGIEDGRNDESEGNLIEASP